MLTSHISVDSLHMLLFHLKKHILRRLTWIGLAQWGHCLQGLSGAPSRLAQLLSLVSVSGCCPCSHRSRRLWICTSAAIHLPPGVKADCTVLYLFMTFLPATRTILFLFTRFLGSWCEASVSTILQHSKWRGEDIRM